MSVPTTIQGISGILRKAGLSASTSSSTRIRGYRSTTSGYELSKAHDWNTGYVAKVSYQPSRSENSEIMYKRLLQLSSVLSNAGYQVDLGGFSGPTDDHDHTLWIKVPA